MGSVITLRSLLNNEKVMRALCVRCTVRVADAQELKTLGKSFVMPMIETCE